MKSPLNFFVVLFLAFGACTYVNAETSSDSTPQTEVYGTASDGTVLHWIVYQPSTPGPWPTVLVIHGGGFNAGSPDSSSESVTCAQDLAAAGYIAFSIEYRLAPPGALPGQTSDGRFPDQSDDVKLAIRTARPDPRCNGQVGAVGGSAGGYQVAFMSDYRNAGRRPPRFRGQSFGRVRSFGFQSESPHALLYRHGDELR